MNLLLKGCLIAGIALTAIGSIMTAFDYAHTLRKAATTTTTTDYAVPGSVLAERVQDLPPQIPAEAEAETLADSTQDSIASAEGSLLTGPELSGLEAIEVELSGGELQFSSGDAPGLWAGEKLLPHLKYARKGDTLIIEDTRDYKWWQGIRDGDPDVSVRLVLPAQEFSRIALSCGIGEADISGLSAEELTISAGAGDVSLKGLSAGAFTLYCGAGELTAKGINTTQSAQINCGIGELSLSGDLHGEVEVKGGIGEVQLLLSASEEDYSISAEAGIGEVRIGGRSVSPLSGGFSRQRKNAQNSLDISCGIGEIDVRFSEGNGKSF